MSFTLTGGSILTEPVALTVTTAVPLYTAKKRTVILSIFAVEVAGATPALTLDISNGVLTYRLRKAVAMTAGQTFVFNEPFALQGGWSLRATAGVANQIECFVTYMSPDATALGWNGQ